jgi:hypothetical protein
MEALCKWDAIDEDSVQRNGSTEVLYKWDTSDEDDSVAAPNHFRSAGLPPPPPPAPTPSPAFEVSQATPE